jgi:hypothetical protein
VIADIAGLSGQADAAALDRIVADVTALVIKHGAAIAQPTH